MNAMMAAVAYCVVGCNTGSPEHDSLKVLECDVDTGAAKVVQSIDNGCEGTTYFQFSQDFTKLYSVIGEKRDEKRVGSAVVFPVGAKCTIGEMKRLAELPCEAPCHVALSPDGKVMSFAAYLSGTYGLVDIANTSQPYTTLSDPKRPYLSAVLPDDAVGPHPVRQKKAYAHQTFYTPDGSLMGVCDLGCDRVNFYDYRAENGLAKPVTTLRADPGDGPRHAIFSHDGRFLFVVNELSSTVTSYSYSKPSTFTRLGKWSMIPPGAGISENDTKAAAIKLTADGKILMASNRGHDSIAFFDVGEGGKLSQRNVAKLTGKFPRDFELMPGEKFMIVGHKMSNEIQVYAFDRAKCTLTPAGAPIPCWRPLCFKFFGK